MNAMTGRSYTKAQRTEFARRDAEARLAFFAAMTLEEAAADLEASVTPEADGSYAFWTQDGRNEIEYLTGDTAAARWLLVNRS